jgi:hypothetical protein
VDHFTFLRDTAIVIAWAAAMAGMPSFYSFLYRQLEPAADWLATLIVSTFVRLFFNDLDHEGP